jgi:hypothetical protein
MNVVLDSFQELNPPENLSKLSQSDWNLLGMMLSREMHLKDNAQLQ